VLVAQEHVLCDRKVGDEIELLVDGGDAAGDRGARIADWQRLALKADLASSRLDQSGHALDQGRLAGPVLPDKAVDLAAVDPQVDAAEGADARIVLDQPADLQQRTADFAHPRP
jgi:hypothetical protein